MCSKFWGKIQKVLIYVLFNIKKIPYFKSIKIRGVNLLCIACYSDAVRLISRKVSGFLVSNLFFLYRIMSVNKRVSCEIVKVVVKRGKNNHSYRI